MKFELGQIVATPAALELLAKYRMSGSDFVIRHVRGDYGDLCEQDKQANIDAINNGGRIFSSYNIVEGVKIWVITEGTDDDGKRQSTCVLTPSCY